MKVEVYRGAGDRPGDDIDAPMLSTEATLIERGRVEMDKRAHQMVTVDIDVIPRAGIRLGQLCSMESTGSDLRRVGKCTGIAIRLSSGDLSQLLTVERPQ